MSLEEIVMKRSIKRLTLLAALFAPFLMTGAALLILPDPWKTLQNTSGADWIWFVLLGAVMLGIYYFLAVYLEDEEEIAVDFQRLDTDHDGFITREDAKNWPILLSAFTKFDKDNDGRLSHVDFEAFENTIFVRKLFVRK
jgi:EF hand